MEKKNNPNWILRIGIFGVIAAVLYICSSPTPERIPDKNFDAYCAAKNEVERYLKAPSTAKFQPYSAYLVAPIDDNTYTVRGYVDAQNTFGAMIRSNFIVKIRGSGSRWYTESLVLDDKRLK